MKISRKIAALGLIAACLSLGGCATFVQSVIGEFAAESSCKSRDTGPDGRSAYDADCLESIDRWQDENPM